MTKATTATVASATNLAISPKSLTEALNHVASPFNMYSGKAKKLGNMFIWGAPGIGKTDIVKQYARETNRRMIAIHLTLFESHDLKGIPIRLEDGTIRWVATSYLPQSHDVYINSDTATTTVELKNWIYAKDIAFYAMDGDDNVLYSHNDGYLPNNLENFAASVNRMNSNNLTVNLSYNNISADIKKIQIVDKSVIFLDELSAAEHATQNAALQLVLDRKINEYIVPTNVPIVAAGNRESDGAFVNTLSAPLANRFTHYTLESSKDDWIDWATTAKLSPVIIGYIEYNGSNSLFNYSGSMDNGNYGFPTPRAWTNVCEQFFDRDNHTYNNMPGPLFLSGIAGYVGTTEARKLIIYLEEHLKLPNPMDILKGKVKELNNDTRRKHLYGLMVNLAYTVNDMNTDFVNKKIDANVFANAGDNMLKFIKVNKISGDIIAFFFNLINKKFGISFRHFIYNSPEFKEFSDTAAAKIIIQA